MTITARFVVLESLHALRLNDSELADTADLRTDLELDSLDFVELAMEIEDRGLITVDDIAFAECKTVGDIIAHVEQIIAKG